MAAIVNIPFNFQPVTSPSRKTASYTVPAGKYAKAILSFYQHRTVSITAYNVPSSITPGWITINGVNVLQERVIGVNINFSSSGNQSYAPLASFSGFGGLFQGFYNNGWRIDSNGSTVVTSPGSTTIINSPCYINFAVLNNLAIYSLSTGGSIVNLAGTITNFQNPEYIEVWLKPGDVINATAGNWQAVVTEYNIPA